MEIVLVRHAESTSNVSRRWQGQGDAPLSPYGEAQMAALAARVTERLRAGWRVDEVVASDLTRAARTGRASFEGLSIDAVWREADVGAWEGLTRAEVAERFPHELAALGEGKRDVALGGGESLDRFWARVDAALASLRARLPADGRAVIFTHGGVIGALVAHVLGKRAVRPSAGLGRLANTAMTTLHFDETHPRGRVLALNDTAHLGLDAVATEERRDGAVPIVTLVATEGGASSSDADAALVASAGASRAAIVEALTAIVARRGGGDVTLALEPRALHAAVVALARVPDAQQHALVVPPHAAYSRIAVDVRLGPVLVDHAITPHKL